LGNDRDLKYFLSLFQNLEYSTGEQKKYFSDSIYGICVLEMIMGHPHGIMVLGTFWLFSLLIAAVGWGAWQLLS